MKVLHEEIISVLLCATAHPRSHTLDDTSAEHTISALIIKKKQPDKKEQTMKTVYRSLQTLALCAFVGVNALGCNTMQGVGRDINEGGRAIESGASEVHDDIHHNNQSKQRNIYYIPRSHTISASAESGGSINPSGNIVVPRGSNRTYIATAKLGYQISDLVVDTQSVGLLPYLYQDNSSSYTFENVAANHVIASFFDINENR